MALELMFKPTGGSAGGGGSSIEWIEAADAPLYSNDNNVGNYIYSDGTVQYLYAAVKVPTTYSGGQVNLRLNFYSSGTSGTVLIQSLATLIRIATDAITSTTNQRTSTNTEVTLSAGTVNEPQAVVCDLTDTSGAINSVSVSAGDLIIVRLTRDTATDTATADANVTAYAAEVTFS